MFQTYFNETLTALKIRTSQIHQVTGIPKSQISSFRHGNRGIRLETLISLLDGIEQVRPGARLYFCQLLAGQPFQIADMKVFIGKLEAQELSYLLYLIGDRLTEINQGKTMPIPQLEGAASESLTDLTAFSETATSDRLIRA